MWSPELVVSIVSFVVTFGTMLYKFGRLEGRVLAKLEEHDRELAELKRAPRGFHVGV